MPEEGDKTVAETAEAAVEGQEERTQEPDRAFSCLMALGDRFENARAKHGGQHQRHDHGEQHAGDDRDGELAVDDAGGTAEEGHRTEQRGHHQEDADQRAGDLLHRFGGGVPRREPLFAHQPFNVLHHHDRIVHQQSDGDHHGEHRQHVDREAEGRQCRAGAQQDDRYGNGRDQRGSDVAHEQPHHQEDQHDGLDQRFDRLADRHAHKRRGVVGIDHLDAGREEITHLAQLCPDPLGGIECIRARRLADRQDGGGLSVVAGIDVIRLRAQLGAPDIADEDARAVRVYTDGDRGEFLGRLQEVLDNDRRVQLLAVDGGNRAELAGGDLDIVGAQGRDHIGDGQVVGGELVGIQPDAHRVLGTEVLDLADARDTGQDFFEVRLRVVAQVVASHAAVLGHQSGQDQVVARRFADLYA